MGWDGAGVIGDGVQPGFHLGQDAELLPRYATWFDDLQVNQREDWVRISGIRAERN